MNASWIAPGHIIRLTLSGQVTINDLAAMRDELTLVLAETPVRLDYVVDLRGLEEVTDKVLQFILGKHGSLRNAKTGCLAVVGGTKDQQLILSSAALALHLTVGYFDDEYEALQFIAESTA
jgi:hypothetical protein